MIFLGNKKSKFSEKTFCLQIQWNHPQPVFYDLLSLVKTQVQFKKIVYDFSPVLPKFINYTIAYKWYINA